LARFLVPPTVLARLLPDPVVDRPAGGGERRGWAWFVAGFAVLALVGVVLELRQPHYFNQDDNFAQFGPGIIYGCRALAGGVFPSWNPQQMLGAPLAELGVYSLTYPPTYLSYFLATYVLRDEWAFMDVFCCLHLAAGYWGTWRLG